MLEIESNDILTLHDELLRELVGRLCEAELESRGLSPSYVIWSGDHKAADGGLDVTVRLPKDTQIAGFIPRAITGFQVKKPDMPAAAIRKEMAPSGKARDSIRELAKDGGAYIIVSAKSSNTELALSNRHAAMKEAVRGMRNCRKLMMNFYERGKLLSWVRRHPGVALWLASKLGKALVGWRPHGAWAARPTESDPGFLANNARRVFFEPDKATALSDLDATSLSDADAITAIRAQLGAPGASIRLIGLSGVGKTRFAEQIFEPSLGSDSLPRSQVFYADTSESPDPPPLGMAERLLALKKPAFLVVDNCPPDLHRSLTNVARRHGSELRVLTIEFDIRDDQAEDTQIVRLDTCDHTTIEAILRARFPSLSGVDVQRIAEFSGGNARLALVAAKSWMQRGPKSGMSDAELLRRIFAQRNSEDDSLLKAAQAAALVYSFSIAPDQHEAKKLAGLSDMTERDFTRRVSKLAERGVAQARSHWRAILPHAIANRLAVEALTAWSRESIEGALVDPAHPRLLASFTKRLGFLHRSDAAVSFVKSWLARDGMLARPETLDSVHASIFQNVAPVCPWDTLITLEAVGGRVSDVEAAGVWGLHSELLRLLAYEADHFTQAARMLATAAVLCQDSVTRTASGNALKSLFYVTLSGTHASVEQRMACLQAVASSEHAGAEELAVACFNAALECEHFSSSFHFAFGATSRDYGYRPQTHADVLRWFTTVLAKALSLSSRPALKLALRKTIADRLPALWCIEGLENSLSTLATSLAEGAYWAEGWRACRRALATRSKRLQPPSKKRLNTLENALAPKSLAERVQAFLVGDYLLDLLDESKGEAGGYKQAERRLARTAAQLGKGLAGDVETFRELLPSLLKSGSRSLDLGCALARRSSDAEAVWSLAIEGLALVPETGRNYSFPMGILRGISETSRPQAERLLDECVEHELMGVAFPNLQAAIGVRSGDAPRVLRAITTRKAPIGNFAHLAYGGVTNDCDPAELRRIVVQLAEEPGGIDPALEILWMRLSHTNRDGEPPEAEIVSAGQAVLELLSFESAHGHDREYRVVQVLEHCLMGSKAGSVAARVARRVKVAMATNALWGDHARRVVKPLLEREPLVVLDELLAESDHGRPLARRWERFGDDVDPWSVVPTAVWKDWCDRLPAVRYPQAAAVVEPHGDGGQWSEIALQLLASSPDPERVLHVFVDRFRPNSWSGSLAAIMERSLRLLDTLDSRIVARMPEHVEVAREHMRVEIARTRCWEKERSRVTDETFE